MTTLVLDRPRPALARRGHLSKSFRVLHSKIKTVVGSVPTEARVACRCL
jgi:hypothetical protein